MMPRVLLLLVVMALSPTTAPAGAGGSAEPGARGLRAELALPPVLSAQPPALAVDGESLHVGWQEGFSPMDGDRVLMSCGVRSHPLDFLGKGGELGVNASARGVHTAALINMRCNYTASYVRGGEVLAELEVPLAPGLANAPSQGHIAFGDSDDQMHVLWVSASSAVPNVRWSTTPSSDGAAGSHQIPPRIATGSSGTYTAEMMCSAPANQTGQQLFIGQHLCIFYRVSNKKSRTHVTLMSNLPLVPAILDTNAEIERYK